MAKWNVTSQADDWGLPNERTLIIKGNVTSTWLQKAVNGIKWAIAQHAHVAQYGKELFLYADYLVRCYLN